MREYAKGKGGHLAKRTDTYDNPWKNRRAAPPQFINTPVTTVSQNVSDRSRRRSERASFPTYSKLCADGGIFVLCTLGLSFGGRGSRSFNSLKRMEGRGSRWRCGEGCGGWFYAPGTARGSMAREPRVVPIVEVLELLAVGSAVVVVNALGRFWQGSGWKFVINADWPKI